MAEFLGREHELALLDRMLERISRGGRAGRPGRAVLMRGRRRVGKSRLAEEFIERAGLPSLFFAASAQPDPSVELALFAEAVLRSDLPNARVWQDQSPRSWEAALHLLARTLPPDSPSIVVLDEMPYLIAGDPGFEGTLQKMFDRELSRLPVLLLCIGSDLGMMEALNDYGRPFHQRATEMVIPPLSPLAVSAMLSLAPPEAFDAYLVTGGLPLVLDEWPVGASVWDYLADAVSDPTSALLVSAERALAAEFPDQAQARHVLGAIGSGERSFALIGRASGVPHASLSRSLTLLTAKRLVEAATPLSTRPSRETRYTVVDPYLRFWLTFLGRRIAEIERGRGDLVLDTITASWSSWRGRAIEPVIRDALRRLPSDVLPSGTAAIGGYWTRTNDPEIDIVGADRAPVAKHVTLVGSIKWLDNRAFDTHDLGRLTLHRSRLPGADESTPLLAVSRSGGTVGELPTLGPEQLLHAWRC